MKHSDRLAVLAALTLALGSVAASPTLVAADPEDASADGARMFDGTGRSAAGAPDVVAGANRGVAGPRTYNALADNAAAHGFAVNRVPPVPAAVKEAKKGDPGKDDPNEPGWGDVWEDWYAKVWGALCVVAFPVLMLGAAAVWLAALAGLVMGGLGGAIASFLIALAVYVGVGTAAILGLLLAVGVTTAIASGAYVLAKKVLARFKPA